MNIETKGFVVNDYGDPSVGIFPATWELAGGFIFIDQEDFDYFVKKIREAWEVLGEGRIEIDTFEQRDERNRQENEAMRKEKP